MNRFIRLKDVDGEFSNIYVNINFYVFVDY